MLEVAAEVLMEVLAVQEDLQEAMVLLEQDKQVHLTEVLAVAEAVTLIQDQAAQAVKV